MGLTASRCTRRHSPTWKMSVELVRECHHQVGEKQLSAHPPVPWGEPHPHQPWPSLACTIAMQVDHEQPLLGAQSKPVLVWGREREGPGSEGLFRGRAWAVHLPLLSLRFALSLCH